MSKSKISFQGFKSFILRNNLIDVAVGLVIGAAFTTLVTEFTKNIIQPLINTFSDSKTASGLTYTIIANKPSTTMDFSVVITAILNFIIIAAVVYYLVIVPFTKLKELETERKRKNGELEEESPSVETLLSDIKILLERNLSSKS